MGARGAAAIADLRAQGLAALRPSFVITAATLSGLDEPLVSAAANGGETGAAARPGTQGSRGGVQTGLAGRVSINATQLAVSEAGGSGGCSLAATSEAEAFKQLLAASQSQVAAAKGKKGRQVTKPAAAAAPSIWPVNGDLSVAGVPDAYGLGHSGWASAADAAHAHLPHAASGQPRHGGVVLPPDAAPLMHAIAALTSIGLLKRVRGSIVCGRTAWFCRASSSVALAFRIHTDQAVGGCAILNLKEVLPQACKGTGDACCWCAISQATADDVLDAPRLALGCVDEPLASQLAADCGLKLANYLKYA